jgi:hypothetical protein
MIHVPALIVLITRLAGERDAGTMPATLTASSHAVTSKTYEVAVWKLRAPDRTLQRERADVR